METKTTVYYDFQVFDYCSKNPDLWERLKNQTKFTAYCSTAHLEEVFRAGKNAKQETERKAAVKRTKCIQTICCPGLVLNPHASGAPPIEAKAESQTECLGRISQYDTRDVIQQGAEHLKQAHIAPPKFSKAYNDAYKDKSVKREKLWKLIWEEKPVCENIESKNALIPFIPTVGEICILAQSGLQLIHLPSGLNDHQRELLASFYGGLVGLYQNLSQIYRNHPEFVISQVQSYIESRKQRIYKGCYEEIRKSSDSHARLEAIVEELTRTLSAVGYMRDKSSQKVNSGEYDIAHMIYSTFCDYFVTNDEALFYRAKAIFHYMEIPTEVILWKDWLQMID